MNSYSLTAASLWGAGKGMRAARQELWDFFRILDYSGNNQSDESHLLSFPSTSHRTISLDENETLLGHACLQGDNDHRSNILTRKISLQLKTFGFLHLQLTMLLQELIVYSTMALFHLITTFTHQTDRNTQPLGSQNLPDAWYNQLCTIKENNFFSSSESLFPRLHCATQDNKPAHFSWWYEEALWPISKKDGFKILFPPAIPLVSPSPQRFMVSALACRQYLLYV